MSQMLSRRAAELERQLRSALGCWVTVGWTKEADGSEVLNVYYDERTRIDYKKIPANYYGCIVSLQPSLPPGAKRTFPDEIDLSDLLLP